MATLKITAEAELDARPPAFRAERPASISHLRPGKLIVVEHLDTVIHDLRTARLLEQLQASGLNLFGKPLVIASRVNLNNNHPKKRDASRAMASGFYRAALAANPSPSDVTLILPRALKLDGALDVRSEHYRSVVDFRDLAYSGEEIAESAAGYRARSDYLEPLLTSTSAAGFNLGAAAMASSAESPNLIVVTNQSDTDNIRSFAHSINGANIEQIPEAVIFSFDHSAAQVAANG